MEILATRTPSTERNMADKKQTKYGAKNQKIEMPKKRDKKNENLFVVCILIVIVILQLGCQPKPQPKICVEFFNTDSSQREKEFPEYDLEKQFTIHRCSLDRKPIIEIYHRDIAKRGKGIIPILLQKLNSNNYKNRYDAEKTKYAIILVFEALSDNGELNNNKQVIKIIEQTVSGIRTDWIKEEAEESLAEIKKNASV